MTIKQQGGVFGRNPTFNDVTVEGTLNVNGEPISDFGTMAQQDANAVNIDGGTVDGLTSLSVSGASGLDGAVTINEGGNDVDFRVEGRDDPYNLMVDANYNAVRIGGSQDTFRVDSGGSNALPKAVVYTDSTGTNRQYEAPTLTLVNMDSALTENRMSRLTFAAISNSMSLPIHSADITAVYTSGAGGNGVTSNLVFGTTNNSLEQAPQEQMKLDENGNLTLNYGNLIVANGQGIDFSATSGTGTSELFDDYEEGSFSPELLFGGSNTGMTYTNQDGVYTKVGNVVHFQIYIRLSAKGTSTGNTSITGLPFSTGFGYNVPAVWWTNMGTGMQPFVWAVGSSTTLIVQANNSGSSQNITNTSFTDTSRIALSGTYRV